jgi:hypothetical protein
MSDINLLADEEQEKGFKGYYLKIGECDFTTPAIKREGFKILPKLVQVTEEQRVASGKLVIKVLPHKPTKIEITFPIMTPEQYRYYKKAFRGELTNEPEMYLTVEYYDEDDDVYKTGIFYHTDISYTPVIYGGQRMILFDTIKLIEH